MAESLRQEDIMTIDPEKLTGYELAEVAREAGFLVQDHHRLPDILRALRKLALD